MRSSLGIVAWTLLIAVSNLASAQPRTSAGDLPPVRLGGGMIDVGIDVGPYRLLEPSTSVGVDLRVRWPSALADVSPIQPYFLLGPTLFVTDPDLVTRTLDPRADTTYGLGVRAGAGVTWSLDPNATLFGEYHVTRGGGERLLPLGRSAGDVSGHDLTYGVRLRF